MGLNDLFIGSITQRLITLSNLIPNPLSNQSLIFLGIKPAKCGISIIAGRMNLPKGFNTLLFNVASNLSLKSIRESFKGWNASFIAPQTPPTLLPSLSLTPNNMVLNSSDAVIIPMADPIAALPKIPKGPPNRVATPPSIPPLMVLGKNLLTISVCFLLPQPSLPNNVFLTASLFLRNPILAPIIDPAIGP